jgi:Bacterial regulatory helix-turn-helix protein, lysR family
MKDVDLNLLTALCVLLREGSVTGAARRLGLSFSAMSRTLSRLRETTGDPLLVRFDGEDLVLSRPQDENGRYSKGRYAGGISRRCGHNGVCFPGLSRELDNVPFGPPELHGSV